MAKNENSVKLNHYLHSSQSHAVLRQWQSRGTTNFATNDFVLPLFVVNNDEDVQPIDSLPEVSRMGVNKCLEYLRPLVSDYGLKSVLLFPVMEGEKRVSNAIDPTLNPVLRLIPKLRAQMPDLLIVCDVCLCTFSPEG